MSTPDIMSNNNNKKKKHETHLSISLRYHRADRESASDQHREKSKQEIRARRRAGLTSVSTCQHAFPVQLSAARRPRVSEASFCLAVVLERSG